MCYINSLLTLTFDIDIDSGYLRVDDSKHKIACISVSTLRINMSTVRVRVFALIQVFFCASPDFRQPARVRIWC